MACRRLTPDDLLNRRIPENAEMVYFRDDFDKGGPVIMAYKEKDVPLEIRKQNHEKIQDALEFVVRRIAEREAAKKVEKDADSTT